MRALHHKIAALMSAVFFFFAGNIAWEGKNMSSNAKRSRPAVPQVYTTRSGSRYVHSIDVIRSDAGRKEISLQMQNGTKRAAGVTDKADISQNKSKS